MSSEMPDSTKELLDAHHQAILRELDRINTGISDIGVRTNHLERRVGVLTWAYGVGVAVLAAIVAKLGLTR